MRWNRVLRVLGHDVLVCLLFVSLTVAPFGCQLVNVPNGLNGDGTVVDDSPPATGLFINEDRADPLAAAARVEGAGAVYVYADRGEAGNFEQLNSVIIETPDGGQSFLEFESGWPVRVQGADGSYAAIEYDQVSFERLAGAVTLFNAADGTTQSFSFEVNPQQSVEEVAAAIEAATGQELEIFDALAAGQARGLNQAAALDKAAGRSSVEVTIFSPLFTLFVAPFVLAIGLAVAVVGQVMLVVIEAAAAVAQAWIVILFAPIFLIGALLNDASVDIEVRPLWTIFEDPPTIG